MASFGGMVLTNRGRNLLAKAQAGIQLNFTRIAVGDGNLGGSSIVDLNALIHQVKSLNITKLKTMTGGKAVVGAVLSNQDITSGFYFREIGVFAQDPDIGEILYCYANCGATAEYIPAGGGPDIIEKSFDIITVIGNALNVTATIDSSMIYASAQDLTTHENDSSIHAKKDGTLQMGLNAEMLNGKRDTDFAGATHTHTVNEITNLFTAFYAGITSGTGNNYTINVSGITSLVDGLCISIKIHEDSTGVSTLNINGLGAKPIKKSNGSDVTNLKANGIYTLRYNATTGNFILQGEGGEGTAQPSDVLSGKTFTNDNGTFTGTMPNKVGSGTVITPGTSDIAIPQGYYGGALADGKVKGDANLVASNIKSGVSIFGILGTFIGGKRWATGNKGISLTGGVGTYTVTGLSFQPSIVLIINYDFKVLLAYINSNYNAYNSQVIDQDYCYYAGYSSRLIAGSWNLYNGGFSTTISGADGQYNYSTGAFWIAIE